MDPHFSIGRTLAVLFWLMAGVVLISVVAWRFLRRRRHIYRPSRYRDVLSAHSLGDRSRLQRNIERLNDQLREDDTRNPRRTFRAQAGLARSKYAVGADIGEVRKHLAAAAQAGCEALVGGGIQDFAEILPFVLAFGTAADRRALDAMWKQRKRSVDEPEALVALLDGVIALPDDVDGCSRRDLSFAAINATDWWTAAHAHAAGSILARDWGAFQTHLTAALHEHRKRYEQDPSNAAGAFNVFALALVRLAASTGFSMPERPYLPTALLAPRE